jgi:hypothetical protein
MTYRFGASMKPSRAMLLAVLCASAAPGAAFAQAYYYSPYGDYYQSERDWGGPPEPRAAAPYATRRAIAALLAEQGYRLVGRVDFRDADIVAFGADAYGRVSRFVIDPDENEVISARRLGGPEGRPYVDAEENSAERSRAEPSDIPPRPRGAAQHAGARSAALQAHDKSHAEKTGERGRHEGAKSGGAQDKPRAAPASQGSAHRAIAPSQGAPAPATAAPAQPQARQAPQQQPAAAPSSPPAPPQPQARAAEPPPAPSAPVVGSTNAGAAPPASSAAPPENTVNKPNGG